MKKNLLLVLAFAMGICQVSASDLVVEEIDSPSVSTAATLLTALSLDDLLAVGQSQTKILFKAEALIVKTLLDTQPDLQKRVEVLSGLHVEVGLIKSILFSPHYIEHCFNRDADTILGQHDDLTRHSKYYKELMSRSITGETITSEMILDIQRDRTHLVSFETCEKYVQEKFENFITMLIGGSLVDVSIKDSKEDLDE